MAVERWSEGGGWCRIRRGGQDLEKAVYGSDFPPTVGDVDVNGLGNDKIGCHVWREGGCGAGAGEGELEGGGGGGGSFARVCVSY